MPNKKELIKIMGSLKVFTERLRKIYNSELTAISFGVTGERHDHVLHCEFEIAPVAENSKLIVAATKRYIQELTEIHQVEIFDLEKQIAIENEKHLS